MVGQEPTTHLWASYRPEVVSATGATAQAQSSSLPRACDSWRFQNTAWANFAFAEQHYLKRIRPLLFSGKIASLEADTGYQQSVPQCRRSVILSA